MKKRIALYLICIPFLLRAQDERWYKSNEFFIAIARISSTQRHKYEYILRIREKPKQEEGVLYRNGKQVGKVLRKHSKGNPNKVLQESFWDAQGNIQETFTYTYDSSGAVVLIQQEVPSKGKSSNQEGSIIKFIEKNKYLVELLRSQKDETINSVRYDSQGRISVQEKWKATQMLLRQQSRYQDDERIEEWKEGDLIIRRTYANGHIISEATYKNNELIHQVRWIYDEKGNKIQENTSEEGNQFETRYTYADDGTLSGELQLKNSLPIRYVDYKGDGRKEELLYWKGKLALKNIYRNEQIYERVEYRQNRVVRRYKEYDQQ